MITAKSNLQQLLAEMPTILPSVRTVNLMSREHVHTVAHLLDVTPDVVDSWRNHTDDTWPDVETLQTCVRMLLNRTRSEPTRGEETQTAFAVRLLQWETWWQAHDAICPSYFDCHIHNNPYQEVSS